MRAEICKRIRTAWNEEEQEWYFSIVDIVGVLTDQPTKRSVSIYETDEYSFREDFIILILLMNII